MQHIRELCALNRVLNDKREAHKNKQAWSLHSVDVQQAEKTSA